MIENFIVRNYNKPTREKIDITTFDCETPNIIRHSLAQNNVGIMTRNEDRENDVSHTMEIFRGLDPEMLSQIMNSLKERNVHIEITLGNEIVF